MLREQHFPFGLVIHGMESYLEDLSRQFARMRPRLEVVAARILGDHEEAADVVSDVFISLVRRPPRSPQALQAWLMVSVRNTALNRLRARGRTESAARDAEVPSTDAETTNIEAEAVAVLLSDAIALLSERDAAFVTARFFEGANTHDLAAEHGTTVSQARIVLHRAVRRLRKRVVERLADLHSVPDGHRAEILAMVGKGEWEVQCRCAACNRLGDELAALRKLRGMVPIGCSVGRQWLKKAAVGLGAAGLVCGMPPGQVPELAAEPDAMPASCCSEKAAVDRDAMDHHVELSAQAVTTVQPPPQTTSLQTKPPTPTIPKTGGQNNTLSYKKPGGTPSLLNPPVDAPAASIPVPVPEIPGTNKLRI